MTIRRIRALQYVRRFNFQRCNKYQSVAEHSYFVAIIAMEVARRLDLTLFERNRILELSLLHDVEESLTGDIPHLVKRYIDNFEDLEDKASEQLFLEPKSERDKEYKDIIDFADLYELKLYLEEERKSGNSHLLDIEQEVYKDLFDICIGDDSIKNEFIGQLEDVGSKNLPNEMTHEGSQWKRSQLTLF